MAETIPVRARRPAESPAQAIKLLPKAPKHLSKESRKLFEQIMATWVLGIDGVEILTSTLEARDFYKQCRAEVARDGPTYRSKSGRIVAHPSCKLANDYLREFRMGMRQLGLNPEGEP